MMKLEVGDRVRGPYYRYAGQPKKSNPKTWTVTGFRKRGSGWTNRIMAKANRRIVSLKDDDGNTKELVEATIHQSYKQVPWVPDPWVRI